MNKEFFLSHTQSFVCGLWVQFVIPRFLYKQEKEKFPFENFVLQKLKNKTFALRNQTIYISLCCTNTVTVHTSVLCKLYQSKTFLIKTSKYYLT